MVLRARKTERREAGKRKQKTSASRQGRSLRVRMGSSRSGKGVAHSTESALGRGLDALARSPGGRRGGGGLRVRAEEEVSWRRAVDLLLAGSLLENSWRTRRAAAAEWKRMKSCLIASRRPTSSRTWGNVSMCILFLVAALRPTRPGRARRVTGPSVPVTWRRSLCGLLISGEKHRKLGPQLPRRAQGRGDVPGKAGREPALCNLCLGARDAVGNSSASLAREESGMSEAKGRPLPLLRKSEKALRRRKVPDVSRKVFSKASLPAPGRLCCAVGTHRDVSCSSGVWRAPFDYFISPVLNYSHCK